VYQHFLYLSRDCLIDPGTIMRVYDASAALGIAEYDLLDPASITAVVETLQQEA
jgi:hypothetical protein